MFRKMLALTVLLLLLCTGAQAAQLLDSGAASIPNASLPASMVAFTGSNAEYLTDQNVYTSWSRAVNGGTGGADLLLMPQGRTMEAIWLRCGDQSSAAAYHAYARPNVVRVEISYLQYDVLYSVSYRFAITDAYQPDVSTPEWSAGYQCLKLPQVINNVASVTLTVESCIPGTTFDEVRISDLMLSSAPNVPAVATASPPPVVPNSFQPIRTTLSMRMATRSGPSTSYDELGSYFKAGYDVTVLSLTHDLGGTPWVQVEFTYKNRLRRAYTGLKRVNVDAAVLPTEEWLADATLIRQVTPRYGPGANYEARNLTINAGQWGSVYAYENGWAQFEYFDTPNDVIRRVWVDLDDLIVH